MKKPRLLLLDANVVIRLFETGIWDDVIARYDICLSRIVRDEAHCYHDDSGRMHSTCLSRYEKSRAITVVDVLASETDVFKKRFGPEYFDRLDPGEAESLTYILAGNTGCVLCSADAIVFRILGASALSDLGISLEEVLDSIGMGGRKLPHEYSKAFRKKWTKKGFEDGLQGRAFSK